MCIRDSYEADQMLMLILLWSQPVLLLASGQILQAFRKSVFRGICQITHLKSSLQLCWQSTAPIPMCHMKAVWLQNSTKTKSMRKFTAREQNMQAKICLLAAIKNYENDTRGIPLLITIRLKLLKYFKSTLPVLRKSWTFQFLTYTFSSQNG